MEGKNADPSFLGVAAQKTGSRFSERPAIFPGPRGGPDFPRTACGVLTVRLYRMFPPTHRLSLARSGAIFPVPLRCRRLAAVLAEAIQLALKQPDQGPEHQSLPTS